MSAEETTTTGRRHYCDCRGWEAAAAAVGMGRAAAFMDHQGAADRVHHRRERARAAGEAGCGDPDPGDGPAARGGRRLRRADQGGPGDVETAGEGRVRGGGADGVPDLGGVGGAGGEVLLAGVSVPAGDGRGGEAVGGDVCGGRGGRDYEG